MNTTGRNLLLFLFLPLQFVFSQEGMSELAAIRLAYETGAVR